MINVIRNNRKVSKELLPQLVNDANDSIFILSKGLEPFANKDKYNIMWLNTDNELGFIFKSNEHGRIPVDYSVLHKLIRVTYDEIRHIHINGKYLNDKELHKIPNLVDNKDILKDFK